MEGEVTKSKLIDNILNNSFTKNFPTNDITPGSKYFKQTMNFNDNSQKFNTANSISNYRNSFVHKNLPIKNGQRNI